MYLLLENYGADGISVMAYSYHLDRVSQVKQDVLPGGCIIRIVIEGDNFPTSSFGRNLDEE